jgi:acyl-CoA reductase-like NAD-dependent aldehyde dehydrogenase
MSMDTIETKAPDAGSAPHMTPVLDPVTGAVLGRVHTTAPSDVADVVVQVARVQPLWALLRLQDRARYMRRMAQAIVDEFGELRETIAREQGRPRTEVAVLELLVAIDALKWVAHEGASVLGGRGVGVHRSLSLTKRARIAYEPYGVVGVIGAGSAPFAQPLGQIAGALLAGNGVVFKPAPRASLTGGQIARVLARAGLPEGLVRVIHGGADVGLELAHARVGVDKLLFTGSPTIGRAVARACVSQEKEVTVELGGKDAMLVLSDAHVARVTSGALWAGYAGAGQARGSLERVYAVPEVYDRLVARLVAGARALTVGDPRDPRVQMGPLASRRRLEHVRELVEDAVARGATLHCGGPLEREALTGLGSLQASDADAGALATGHPSADGTRADGPQPGAFFAPAVLTGVNHEMRLMREPIGGPVLAVMTVGSVSEAIALANDSAYGLGASVWTTDRYRGMRIARELDAGMVWLNDHLPSPAVARGPWGAAAGSGLGRTLGEAGLRACAQEKLITWDPSGSRGLWWGPYDELSARAAQTAARLRSTRESDRERAWREGGFALARVGLRALGRKEG